jgi:hypothetical protein
MTFAWSTGILITLAQEFQDQRLQRHDRSPGATPGDGPPAEKKPVPGPHWPKVQYLSRPDCDTLCFVTFQKVGGLLTRKH